VNYAVWLPIFATLVIGLWRGSFWAVNSVVNALTAIKEEISELRSDLDVIASRVKINTDTLGDHEGRLRVVEKRPRSKP